MKREIEKARKDGIAEGFRLAAGVAKRRSEMHLEPAKRVLLEVVAILEDKAKASS